MHLKSLHYKALCGHFVGGSDSWRRLIGLLQLELRQKELKVISGWVAGAC
jgi:hypothetical protein